MLKSGERACWVTLLHDYKNGVDVVIGAGTRQACIEAFERISPGTAVNPDLVYHAVWRKADLPGYGFAMFRAATLTALREVGS
jgi:hypothetical protein